MPTSRHRYFHRYAPCLHAVLACSIALPLPARAEAAMNEAVKDLARYQATLDLCMKSSDFRNVPEAVVQEFAAMGKTINHLENDLHEAPKGKMMYVTYQFNIRAYLGSVEFRKQLQGQTGGVCDYQKTKAIALKLRPLEASIRRYIGARK